MLNAKRFGEPLHPILVHALVHATLMFLFLFVYGINLNLSIGLALYQLGTHFIIDVWKGKTNKWFPKVQSPANKIHWAVFGFDQFLHAVIIIEMTYNIVN